VVVAVVAEVLAVVWEPVQDRKKNLNANNKTWTQKLKIGIF
jgi:hypothetical protein